jgi:hypothetical protein
LHGRSGKQISNLPVKIWLQVVFNHTDMDVSLFFIFSLKLRAAESERVISDRNKPAKRGGAV